MKINPSWVLSPNITKPAPLHLSNNPIIPLLNNNNNPITNNSLPKDQQQSPSSPVFINNNVAPAPASPTVIFAGGPNQGGCASGNHQMVERTKAMGWVWCILCWWNPVCWVCLCRKKHTCRQCGYSPDAGPCGA